MSRIVSCFCFISLTIFLNACFLNVSGRVSADSRDDASPVDADIVGDVDGEDEGDADEGAPDADIDADVDGDGDSDADADGDGDTDADVDADTDADEETFECVGEEVGCDGDRLETCVDGHWVESEVCLLGCSVVHERCYGLDPSNVSHGFFIHGSESFTISSSLTVSTNDCEAIGAELSADALYSEVVPAGDIELCVVVADNVTIDEGAELRVTGGRILVVLASGTIMIHGTLDVGARMAGPGAGGGQEGASDSDAPGVCGGGRGFHEDVYHDSGGGGGGHGAPGGHGSDVDGADPGRAGDVAGNRELDPITAGCGGGGGSAGGCGGAGGGAVQLSSSISVIVGATGIVRAPGGGGDGGTEGAGGGGAGGGILIEAPEIEIQGIIAANGGGGGSGDGDGDGSDGLDSEDRAPAGTNTGSFGGEGGRGGAGETTETGENAPAVTYDGGGGGGGVGRIRLNTRLSVADIADGATVSPSGALGFSEGVVTTW